MEDKSIKEYLIECLFPDEVVGINEKNGENLKGSGGGTGPSAPANPVNDPDKNAENPDPSDLFINHRSVLFLTASNDDGIIKRGEGMGFLELNEEAIEQGLEVDLEDFQWWCLASEFEKYLEETGRKYNSSSGEWTSESEEPYETERERKISSYSDFLENKKELNETDFIDLAGGTKKTSMGTEYSGKSPDFQRGKLTDTQRKFIKFIFTRNSLRNEGKIQEKLDLKTLEKGNICEIFVSAFDPSTGETDETATIGITLKVIAKIEGGKTPIIVCQITQIAPNLGGDPSVSGFDSVLEAVVQRIYSFSDEFTNILDSTSGKIFTMLGALSAMQGAGIIGTIGLWRLLAPFRSLARSQAVLAGARPGVIARGFSYLKGRGKNFLKYPFKQSTWKGGAKNAANALKWPFKALKNYKTYKKYAFLNKGKKALKGWKLARYLVFGRKIAGTASKISRGARVLSGVAKITNPLGWILILSDVVGSALNYTSDNQAPSWDPMIGGKEDAMKNYSKTICPSASNVFNPGDIPQGETITLCWTQNPEKGWGLALSFVVSNSTRTTMNITKVYDFKGNNETSPSMSLFIINSVNYKDLWDKIKGYDIKFLFIKSNTYSEGYRDDNIGAYFLGGNSPDPKNIPPLAYYGHCKFEEFKPRYEDAPDQLVIIDGDAPKDYKFYFYDSESNPINVIGTKVKDVDIEDASEEEINSFFDVEPISSYIGDPEGETEEERAQREEAENNYRASKTQGEDQEESEEGEEEDLAKNESIKWYSSIQEPKPITSFNDFRIIKESILENNGDGKEILKPVEELPTGEKVGEPGEKENADDPSKVSISDRVLTAKQFQENFEKILNTVEKPAEFAIYFVEKKEYADPSLRNIYKPGTFTNFHITTDAISASNNSPIEGEVQVNNLDFLIDPRKGEYTLSSEEKKENQSERDQKRGKGYYSEIEASDDILTSSLYSKEKKKEVFDVFTSKEKEDKKLGVIQRIDPDILKSVGITEWNDVTSVKIIKDREGNPKIIKINNKKASIGDKLRRFEKGDPNFEDALKVADAYRDKIEDEEELEKQDKR
jgi:hypothetical protein